MRTSRLALALGTISAATLAWALSGADAPIARAAPAPLDGPVVAYFAGVPRTTTTDLYFVKAGEGGVPALVATIDHLADAVVRGAVLPGTSTVLATADTTPSRDRSWASALIRLDSGAAPVVLVSGVAHGARPLVDAKGRVFVERGAAGELPITNGKHEMRIDALSVDRIDPTTGSTVPIYSGNGYGAHLVGALDDEVFVYRVGPAGADLVAVDIGSRALRVIVPSWPPMARDFSMDTVHRAVVAQQMSADRRFVTLRIDVKTGASEVLAESQHADMVPFALPGGGVMVNPEGSPRTAVVGPGAQVDRGSSAVLWARASSGSWVGALRLQQSQLPVAVVFHSQSGALLPLPDTGEARVEIAGFVGGAL